MLPPQLVASVRWGWRRQWKLLMAAGLGPADTQGNYQRAPGRIHSEYMPLPEGLDRRSQEERPILIIARSCPWAHRAWLMVRLRGLEKSLELLIAEADAKGGRWCLSPPWRGCHTLAALYQLARETSMFRATVPLLIDPLPAPQVLSNESALMIELLNLWPASETAPNLAPHNLKTQIQSWHLLLQSAVNDGVYRCGFARSQAAYNTAESTLFAALDTVEASLADYGPWLCGDQLTLADVRLFPTLIRWEMVYAPLFGCSRKPLWCFPHILNWRHRFYNLLGVTETCDAEAWRRDYFGALFPLNPGGIIPGGPDLGVLTGNC